MKEFDKRLASLVCHNGEHHIVLPSGELLPCIVSTEVRDEIGQKRAEVIIKAKVNIAESVDDAKRKYQDYELVCRVDGKDLIKHAIEDVTKSIEDAIRQCKDNELVCKVSGKDLIFALDRKLQRSEGRWLQDETGRVYYNEDKPKNLKVI